jgi:surface polysaccharide O-acyltransferase-like enzyme
MAPTPPKRHYGLDILRVIACYMVIQVHSGEFYYIGNIGQTLNTPDAHWVGWYNSICRTCVPLFVMLSGFFLFPVDEVNTFFKKRFSRVAIPFIIWCALYAFYFYFTGQGSLRTELINIPKTFVNFGTDIGHLWFVYMLLGIYLFAPVISPWVQTASHRNMELYLVLWAISLSVPYIHLIFPQILGEAFWNHTPMLYYFSGFLGYAILAAYIRRFHLEPRRWNYSLGLLLIVLGYGITLLGFLQRLPTEKFVDTLELTWGFETINVAMMSAGLFLILKTVNPANTGSSAGWRLLLDVSAKSYGIYLVHIILLDLAHFLIDKRIGTAAIKVPLMAIVAFILSYLVIKLLSYLPKSKYLIG